MAQKKRDKGVQKPAEFHAAPFGILKGLSLHPSKSEKRVSTPEVEKPKPEQEANEVELFLHAVQGAKPLRGTTADGTRGAVHPPARVVADATAPKDQPAADDNAFLEEISRLKLDSKFSDATPNEDELQTLSGNRLRMVRRGTVSVGRQLDLHGLTRDEAMEALPRFLASAVRGGEKAVLVITGKGLHSTEEPVLSRAVASWLKETGRTLVLEYAPAPREMGGSGAYVVFLRQKPNKEGSTK